MDPTDTIDASAKIKGAAVADFLAWLEKTQGEEVVRQAWASLPASAHDELGQKPGRLLAFRWYSAQAIGALIDATTAHLSPAERAAMARDGTRAIIDSTLRGLYGSIFRMLVNPRRYIERAQTVWSLFHNTGDIVGEQLGPREHVTRLRNWRGRHPFIVLLNQSFAWSLYESMGCRGVIVEGHEEHDAAAGVVDVVRIRWMDDPA